MTDDEIIAVVQAHKEGKQIQYSPLGSRNTWTDCYQNEPLYNFHTSTYRVKPEPREWWVNTYNNGHAYAHKTEEEANKCFDSLSDGQRAIHVREVIDDE